MQGNLGSYRKEGNQSNYWSFNPILWEVRNQSSFVPRKPSSNGSDSCLY